MSSIRIDLSEKNNPQCLKDCDRIKREEFAENYLCKIAKSIDDGLPVRCVGEWAQEKIYFLRREFEIFANGMKNKWDIGYFEIGCGPGRCIDRKTGKEFDGTALAILKSTAINNIKIARFIDIQDEAINALTFRINALSLSHKVAAIKGDYTDGQFLADIISQNHNGLNLVFIDPTDCSVPFSTIQKMNKSGVRFDIIINISTKTDFTRNIKFAIESPSSDVRKKYELFLGNKNFFASENLLSAIKSEDYKTARILFVEEYQKMLTTLGFKYFGREQIH